MKKAIVLFIVLSFLLLSCANPILDQPIIEITDITSTTATISWTPDPDAYIYDVLIGKNVQCIISYDGPESVIVNGDTIDDYVDEIFIDEIPGGYHYRNPDLSIDLSQESLDGLSDGDTGDYYETSITLTNLEPDTFYFFDLSYLPNPDDLENAPSSLSGVIRFKTYP